MDQVIQLLMNATVDMNKLEVHSILCRNTVDESEYFTCASILIAMNLERGGSVNSTDMLCSLFVEHMETSHPFFFPYDSDVVDFFVTSINYAAKNRMPDYLRTLTDVFPLILPESTSLRSAIVVAVQVPHNEQCLRVLLDHGVDVTFYDYFLLHIAIRRNINVSVLLDSIALQTIERRSFEALFIAAAQTRCTEFLHRAASTVFNDDPLFFKDIYMKLDAETQQHDEISNMCAAYGISVRRSTRARKTVERLSL